MTIKENLKLINEYLKDILFRLPGFIKSVFQIQKEEIVNSPIGKAIRAKKKVGVNDIEVLIDLGQEHKYKGYFTFKKMVEGKLHITCCGESIEEKAKKELLTGWPKCPYCGYEYDLLNEMFPDGQGNVRRTCLSCLKEFKATMTITTKKL